jgi:hypothetical protein
MAVTQDREEASDCSTQGSVAHGLDIFSDLFRQRSVLPDEIAGPFGEVAGIHSLMVVHVALE